MSVCVLQNLEKYRVLWTDFLASCRETNRFSVSKIGPEPAKPTIFSSPVCRVNDFGSYAQVQGCNHVSAITKKILKEIQQNFTDR